MQKFTLEFILNASNTSADLIMRSLMQAGEEAKVLRDSGQMGQESENFQVRVSTGNPTLIFDICSQFGRISSIKIDEKVK